MTALESPAQGRDRNLMSHSNTPFESRVHITPSTWDTIYCLTHALFTPLLHIQS